jgi:hypothetical protein
LERIVRKTLAAIGVAALASLTVSLTGCGGSSSSGGSTPSISMGAAGVDQLRAAFQRAEDAKQTVAEAITVGSGSDLVTQNCKIQLRPTLESDCTTPGQAGQGQVRTITMPNAVYTYQSDPDLQLDGKPWHRGPAQTPPADFAQSGGDGGVFTAGAAQVTAINSDTVDGRSSTRYDIALDFDKLIKATLSRNGSQLGGDDALAQMSAGGSASGQVWLGSDGLPVQVSVTTVFKDQAPQTQTYRYSNWGTPVSISAPPAGQVSADPTN